MRKVEFIVDVYEYDIMPLDGGGLCWDYADELTEKDIDAISILTCTNGKIPLHFVERANAVLLAHYRKQSPDQYPSDFFVSEQASELDQLEYWDSFTGIQKILAECRDDMLEAGYDVALTLRSITPPKGPTQYFLPLTKKEQTQIRKKHYS